MDSRKSIKTYYGFIMVKKLNGTICGRFPVTKKECIFGRDDKSDIKILLENVSGHHCSIYYIDDKAYIRDKSSSGSTKVNGKRIGQNNFLLHHLDEIEICNRKFVWEYANAYYEKGFNNLSNKKLGIKADHTTPRLPERTLNQIKSPQDNKRISFTPVKNITKTPSKTSTKTLISINKTPIVVASANLSKYSFDELKNSLQKQNSSTKCQSEHLLSRSYSMVPGRNIPLISDSKSTPRKSWVVTNSSNNLSSSGAHILNKLSTERLKRDSTPEFNSSYHYQDENVEFDSPEPVSPSAISNADLSAVQDNKSLAENNLSVDQSESVIHQKDDDFQTFSNKTILNTEPEANSSRRDTYSIDAGSIVFEQNSTPTPRRSILKCSKTTKPNRSRSSCRMVQFARLPNTDSRIIKMPRSRSKTVPNFVVTDDVHNGADVSQDSKNVTQFDVEEEYDDDLDGVQPLDISVSSLINSPILDISSIHKSAKRGSRGNKVMSLISSFENRTHDSPKHSIRASDLLSMNGSKTEDKTLNNDSQRNSNALQDSVSSTRRINLEDVFVAEDSLKDASCTHKNKTIVHEIDVSSDKHVEIASNPESNTLNSTVENKTMSHEIDENSEEHVEMTTRNTSDKVSGLSNDVSRSECEFNFASPLKIQPEIDSRNITVSDINLSTFVSTEEDNNLSEVNTQNLISKSQPNLSSHIDENCKKIADKSLIVSNNSVENSPRKSKTSDPGLVQNNSSKNMNTTSSDECSNKIKNSIINVTPFVEIKVEDLNQEENNVSALTNNSIGINKDNLDKQNDVSKLVDEESPSMIVQCMSKMFNSSVDELEKTHSQHEEGISESYVLVNTCDIQNRSEKTVTSTENLNKSLMDAIEVQLDKIHDTILSSKVDENESNSSLDTNIEKTLTSSIVSDRTEIENPNLEINDNNSSKDPTNVLLDSESTTNKINSASKTKLSEDNYSSIIQNADVSHLSMNKSDTSKNINSSSKSIKVNSLNNEKDDSKLINNTNQETLNISNQTRNSRNLNKSKQPKKDVSTNAIKNKKTRSSQKIVDEISLDINSDSDVDEREISKKIDKSIEGTLDTSFGKPQYVSTPWNGSKSSKILNSTCNQPNETSHDDVPMIVDKQNKTTRSNSTYIQDDDITENIRNIRSRSTTPNFEPDVWSQMMKDFNESVKKASCAFSNNDSSNNCKIVPINEELKSSKISIKVTTDEGVTSNFTDTENITQKADKNNTIQRSMISSRSHNNTQNISIEHNQSKRSTRNSVRSKSHTEITKRSPRAKNLESKCTKLEVDENSKEIIDNVVSPNKKTKINTSTRKQSSVILLNLSSDNMNDNSQGTEKPLPSVVKSITNGDVKNDKTTSNKPKIAFSTPESNHDSNTDSSINKSLRLTRNKKMTKKKHSSPELPPTRRNLRVKVEQNKKDNLNKKLQKVDIKVTDSASSENDTETGSVESTNTLPTIKRGLRKREQNLCSEDLKPIKDKKKLTSNKPLKDTSILEKNTSKIVTNEKSTEIQSKKTRFTRSHSTLNESSLPKLNKKTRSSSPIKTKSVKVGKIKKTTSLRTNKKSQLKSLPSKPVIKKNKSDTSEYESLSDTEEIPPKTEIVNNRPKTRKENVEKKNIKINNSSLPTRRNQRDIIETLNVSSPPSSRSRKRAADTSPLYQPNTKGSKRDISSKIASTSNSRVSNSPKECAPPTGTVKLTRNKSKLEVPQSSQNQNSFPEPDKIEKKEKFISKSVPKKRVLPSDESSIDAVPSAKRITRKAKENESSNNSFPETAKIGKKDKITTKSVPKKRVLPSDESSIDAELSAKRITRKAKENESSNNSFPETAKIGKKDKITAKSVQKKQIQNSDESSMDSAPSARKTTRRVKENDNEIKKSNSSSRSKKPNTDTDDSNNSPNTLLNKDVDKFTSPKPMKKRTTKQAVQKSKNSPPPRVLRSKRK